MATIENFTLESNQMRNHSNLLGLILSVQLLKFAVILKDMYVNSHQKKITMRLLNPHGAPKQM